VKFIDDALAQQRDRPLMVLALARPEVRTKFPALWDKREVQEIRLAGLTRKACDALIQEALGAVEADVAGQLAERAQGNAFFLEELIRAVANGSGDALPETVLAMLQRRIESQSPIVRHLLRAASVFGRDFWDDGVAALVGGSRSRAEVRYDLVALVESELLTRVEESRFPASREYRFRHDLLSDAVYATLTAEDRTLGHRLAAAWLKDTGERDPLVLAGHHERGGELSLAAAMYHAAANEAFRADDPAATLRHVASARRCGVTGELAGRLHDVAACAWWRRGRFDETEREALEAMAALPRTSAEWHRAAMLVVIARAWTGRSSELADPLEALRSVPDSQPIAAWHLIAWSGVSGSVFRLGRNEDALFFVERVERRAREVGPDEAPLHIVRHYRAYFWTHEPEVATSEAEAAASILEHAGEAGTRDTMVIAAADCAIALGAIEEGERALRAWLAVADTGHHLVASAKLSLARALHWRGCHEEALTVIRDAFERSVAVRHRLREGQSRCVMAEILAASGDIAGAMREARAAAEVLMYSVVSHPQGLAVVASAHLLAGETADALVAARAAYVKMCANSVTIEIEADVRLTYAEALHAAGEYEEARAAIAEARDRLVVRAGSITLPAHRERFLARVPAHARTMAHAREWLHAP
jgi:tetratricopeptide (TPR) repeat protein